MLPAYRKRAKRRLIGAPKFYYFDIGIVAHLTQRGKIRSGSELFGRAFEHLIFMELTAHSSYSEANCPIAYWKTASGFEVDFVLGDHEIAIEIKGTDMVINKHMKGIRAFKEEYHARSYIVVSLDNNPRRTKDGIEILPWHVFLDRLWANEIINT